MLSALARSRLGLNPHWDGPASALPKLQIYQEQESGWEMCKAACEAQTRHGLSTTGCQEGDENRLGSVLVYSEGHRFPDLWQEKAKSQGWCIQRHD